MTEPKLPAITKPGTVTIQPGGYVVMTDFEHNTDVEGGIRLALEWALHQIKERCWEAGIRNLGEI